MDLSQRFLFRKRTYHKSETDFDLLNIRGTNPDHFIEHNKHSKSGIPARSTIFRKLGGFLKV